MRETQNLSKGNDLNCSKVSENFHAGHGFFITSSKMPFKWSQINNKRLRCEYEDEFVSFLAQATQSISGFTGGKAALNCTLSNREILFLDVQRGRLKLSCPLCDPNADQSIIDRVFKRFDDNDTLREAISFWQHSQKNISKFCECIDQIGDGKSCKFLSNSSISPEQLPVFAELKLSQSTIVTPLLFLLSSLAVLIFCIFFILQKAQRSETSHSSDREMKEMTPLQMEILMEAAVDFHEDIQIVKIEQTYEERSIGVGEFGKVCELIDHNPPAVKKCLRKKSQTDSQTSLMRFKQEFMILRALNHPNVVHLLHMETIEGSNDFGIVMEYCQRGNLGNIMCNPRIIYSMKTVIVWSEELFDAVDYMFREHKVIHRDIKPENIFVTMDFVLKIGDFGLAKFIEKTCVGSFAGTHRYMSPTRSKEGDDLQASHRNDVYALGLVLWEIVERRMVFWEYGSRGSFNPYNFLADIIQKKLKRLSTPNCQREIRELIKRCTNFDRSSRPMAVEVLEEIRRIEQSDSFISSLLLKPLEKNEQQKVLRPIGFDDCRRLSRFRLLECGCELDEAGGCLMKLVMCRRI
ncbi:unnamed protein product, partial [Mesorhabditis belari]|uniref:Protein kinase domain-containing protein n=1 Tax=Mesorhabditis belari TaxID=2138241 RepID=A0AAF3F0K0_9BILA